MSALHRLLVAWAATALGLVALAATPAAADEMPGKLTLSWANNFLVIHGEHLPKGQVRVHYLEAYCRPGSTDRDWRQTVIPHKTELISVSTDRRSLKLRCTLADGVVVTHDLSATDDAVRCQLVATNPTQTASEVHWAQPCIRVDTFTGRGQRDYVPSCFIFLDGRLTRLPTQPWADKARYTPGQVYCPKPVDRRDVNPRPLSELVPSNGLIGCFSGDEKMILASAWEPYQELFQGVAVCVHSDFRIGGLQPGQSKQIRGTIYLVPADVPALVQRYERDFPEQVTRPKP